MFHQSRKYKCGNKRFGKHWNKRSWFENVNTTVALRITATTNNLTGSSIQTAIISIAQFSPPFSNVVTTNNIKHYPLKLKDEDLSSWEMEEKGITWKDFSIDHNRHERSISIQSNQNDNYQTEPIRFEITGGLVFEFSYD